jgi:alkanesulfonate monooxygenase SsuD/methylene tetrahydromethanopterin reductase-like flavin-dependent oxidoreductase (luciferase family)
VVPPKLVLVLTENWTMLPGTDLTGLVRMAREAEDSGFDAVMLSEHVVLGPDAGAAGVMDNPRDIDDPRDLPAFCRQAARRAAELTG